MTALVNVVFIVSNAVMKADLAANVKRFGNDFVILLQRVSFVFYSAIENCLIPNWFESMMPSDWIFHR